MIMTIIINITTTDTHIINFTQFYIRYHFNIYNKITNTINFTLININYYYINNIQN